MRFMIFGAGALGSVLAARLAEVHPVSLVGRREHVKAIRNDGLCISGHTELVQTDLEAVTDPRQVGTAPGVVLVTVKAFDTPAAVDALSALPAATLFVSLQNGLGNEEVIAAAGRRVIGGVINQGATLLAPGKVFHAGSGEIALGPFAGTGDDDARAVAAALAAAGFPALAVSNIRRRIWAKAVLNAAVNPLSALLRKRTGELVESAALRDVVRRVVDESVGIATACGIELQAAELIEDIARVAAATRDNKSSMLQDLERGGRTEIEAINGALVERAHQHGVACPVNELLADLVRAAEGR